MKEKERDTFEELFRSKLYDFEAETESGDWEAVAGRLTGAASVPFRRKLGYWAAAAVVSLLVVTGSIFLYKKEAVPVPLAQEIESGPEAAERQPEAAVAASFSGPAEMPVGQGTVGRTRHLTARLRLSAGEKKADRAARSVSFSRSLPATHVPAMLSVDGRKAVSESFPRLVTEVRTDGRSRKVTTARKWGFGMGAGSLSVGASQIVPQYVTNSYTLRSESLLLLNAASFNEQYIPKTDIHHKTPVSFGFSVSRYLNNRFSLQTGVVYTFLSSDWKTNGDPYSGKTEQKLHFIGIPLSIVYKIAEWNRFDFYASAGGMAEVNVAGKRNIRLFSGEEVMGRTTERVRMKEWQWSVNARAGVSYPLIRFVSAFAEVGAAYYFDNGSPIETVRSEKPFNVNLQFGFRLGF